MTIDTRDAIGLVLLFANAVFWLWVYVRLDTSPAARRIWQFTWARGTAWQDPRWVLVFSIAMFLLFVVVAVAMIHPEKL